MMTDLGLVNDNSPRARWWQSKGFDDDDNPKAWQ